MPHRSDLRLLALHGLRLKGFAEPSVVARLFSRPEPDVEVELRRAADEGLTLRREGRLRGWTLTPDGRKHDEALLAGEVDQLGLRDLIRHAYDRFLALNGEMLATCTRWQVRGGEGGSVLNDHSDPGYDEAVIGDLGALHDRVRPVCGDLAASLERFTVYEPRFGTALQRVRAGEPQWFTKPIIESYHTVWFELHEDLLASLGIDRSEEAQP
jgi:hypothetical protein